MRIIAIIPARMNSSRFPGKPLKLINNVPMIGHCYYRSKMSKSLDAVYVATCDEEISNYIKSINGKVIMTSKKHKRATERVSEAMLKIEALEGKKTNIVVMIQGDEPMITPDMINMSIKPFQNKNVDVVNLASKLDNQKQIEDPNEIKVVMNARNEAIYFSRSPIPYNINGFSKNDYYKQVCIIPFRRDYLIKFNQMKETSLEKLESVDMLRIIENGDKVKIVKTNTKTYSVDNRNDLLFVDKKMKNDKLITKYKNNI